MLLRQLGAPDEVVEVPAKFRCRPPAMQQERVEVEFYGMNGAERRWRT